LFSHAPHDLRVPVAFRSRDPFQPNAFPFYSELVQHFLEKFESAKCLDVAVCVVAVAWMATGDQDTIRAQC
jgi:hypothetical protein